MPLRTSTAVLTLAATLATLSTPAAADVVLLPAERDNTLIETGSGDLSNGAGSYFFAGNTDGNGLRRGLLAFDIAGAVPAGATINSVTLTLRMSRTKAGDESVSLHRVTSDWGEGTSNGDGQEGGGAAATDGDATWLYTFYDTLDPMSSPAWSSNGGDFVGTASDTITVGGNGVYMWSSAQMATDVQDWLDGMEPNDGWILIGNEAALKTSKRFNSRENGTDPPMLSVDFTAPPASGACCDALGLCTVPGGSTECTGQGGTYQGDGTMCTPNPCPQPTGACCQADAAATCTEVTEASCTGTWQGALSVCTPNPCPVVLTPYLDALPVPAPAAPVSGTSGGVATYDIAMREVQQQLHSQLPMTTVWGYGDGPGGASYPGPTIEAATGLPVTVNWINDLRDTSAMGTPLRTSHILPVDTCPHGADDASPRTVVHLHGGHVPAAVDGHPEATFEPGQQVQYVYPNNQLPSTLWFHDHALGITRLNVYMGLAGFYLIRDSVEQGLGLPSGTYEVPIVIQDRTFNPDGSLQYPSAWQDSFLGDTFVVNGKAWPTHAVDQGKVRLRLLNGCNTRTLTLAFCPGSDTSPCPAPATFQLLGQEGGLLEAPVPLTQITLGPAERADVVYDFAAHPSGTQVFLVNSAPAPFPGPAGVGVIPNVMRFDVGSGTGHTAALPGSLRTMEVLDENDATVQRTFELKKNVGADMCSPFRWEVVTTEGLNGTELGARWEDITEYPERGETEIWSFINRSGMMHPMHMHLVMFQLLDREPFSEDMSGNIVPSGVKTPPPPEESGWKDTVRVGPDEIVRVIARFDDYTGRFPYHCHILEHEDHEMMREFQVVSCGDGVLEPTEECDDGNDAAGDGCNAACELEDELAIHGIAQGGSVSLSVDGEPLVVPTSPGDPPGAVAQAIADAINGSAALQSAGVTAFADGNRVVTNGTITNVVFADAGLSAAPQIPLVSPWGVGLLGALLAAAGAAAARRRA